MLRPRPKFVGVNVKSLSMGDELRFNRRRNMCEISFCIELKKSHENLQPAASPSPRTPPSPRRTRESGRGRALGQVKSTSQRRPVRGSPDMIWRRVTHVLGTNFNRVGKCGELAIAMEHFFRN